MARLRRGERERGDNRGAGDDNTTHEPGTCDDDGPAKGDGWVAIDGDTGVPDEDFGDAYLPEEVDANSSDEDVKTRVHR